ncbi:HAD-IA family hydrolase [Nakamurella sp. YIM 132087]|uniref:HAD-IA family hydrolase n=1 Tax=Nakamurella alba TaxID=2665158 RepID=A0A7K1FG56_9ACTN|nr:HAD family hydrolase [Nakamurella alba]MTD13105.1 HAD-IA family hydrolase [Nakamurella alba]
MPEPRAAAGTVLPVEAVLFDIDDTLVDFHGAAMSALAEATAVIRGQLEVDAGRLVELWESLNDREYGRFLSGELDFDAMRNARMQALLGELDPERVTAWDHRLVEEQRNSSIFGFYTLFPDVRPCLDRLREQGIAVGIISNSDGDYQRRKLRTVGLHEFVDTAVCSGDVGVSKPDPAIFTLAVEQLGVHPAHAVYVGDRWFTDTVGALRAGLGGVWLNRERRPRPEVPTAAEDVCGPDDGSDPTLGRLFAEIGSLDDLRVVPRSARTGGAAAGDAAR